MKLQFSIRSKQGIRRPPGSLKKHQVSHYYVMSLTHSKSPRLSYHCCQQDPVWTARKHHAFPSTIFTSRNQYFVHHSLNAIFRQLNALSRHLYSFSCYNPFNSSFKSVITVIYTQTSTLPRTLKRPLSLQLCLHPGGADVI